MSAPTAGTPTPRPLARASRLFYDDLLAAITERREAALIFTSYVSMAHLLAGHLRARGTSADIVHGGIPAARRQEIVDRFQSGAGGVSSCPSAPPASVSTSPAPTT